MIYSKSLDIIHYIQTFRIENESYTEMYHLDFSAVWNSHHPSILLQLLPKKNLAHLSLWKYFTFQFPKYFIIFDILKNISHVNGNH